MVDLDDDEEEKVFPKLVKGLTMVALFSVRGGIRAGTIQAKQRRPEDVVRDADIEQEKVQFAAHCHANGGNPHVAFNWRHPTIVALLATLSSHYTVLSRTNFHLTMNIIYRTPMIVKIPTSCFDLTHSRL